MIKLLLSFGRHQANLLNQNFHNFYSFALDLAVLLQRDSRIYIIIRKLQSNRGEISKFTIEKSVDGLPYPRAHTCFNRLELPPYKSFEQMNTGIRCCLNENNVGVFGME